MVRGESPLKPYTTPPSITIRTQLKIEPDLQRVNISLKMKRAPAQGARALPAPLEKGKHKVSYAKTHYAIR